MATEYCVLENNRPACYPNGTNWTIWKYRTYEEAFEYAKQWLGVFGQNLTKEMLPVGIPYFYNGHDTIMIALINNPQ